MQMDMYTSPLRSCSFALDRSKSKSDQKRDMKVYGPNERVHAGTSAHIFSLQERAQKAAHVPAAFSSPCSALDCYTCCFGLLLFTSSHHLNVFRLLNALLL